MKHKIEINYEDRIVCFLDILGFKNHILSSINFDGSDCTKKIEDLAEAFSEIRDILDIDRPEERVEKEVTQFSDSIVISFKATKESEVYYTLLDILWVQISLVQRGILCRGSVARGKLIHTPQLLFGPAMVEAYTLESEVAMYPRIILGKAIIQAGIEAHARHHLPHHEAHSILNLVKKDSDGMYYINYVTGAQPELDDPELDYPNYLFRLRKIISSGSDSKTPSIAIKYSWLKEKLEPHLTQIKQHIRTKPIDDEIREAYESIPDF